MATYEQVIEALRNADAQGNVEDAKALAVIADAMRPQVAEQQPVAPTQERTIPQEIGRQAGLAGRAIISGLSAPITAFGDFAQGAGNLARIAVGKQPVQLNILTSQGQQEGLTGMGLPTPETTSERISQVGMQGIASLPTMKPFIPSVGTSLVREVPAAMVAPMAAQPVAEQVYKLTDSDLAATVAGLGVGYVAGGMAGKAGSKWEQRGQPVLTMDEVRQRATRAYNKVEQAGIELNQQSSLNLLNDIKNEVQAGRWPSTFGGVKVVEDHPGGHGIHFHWVIKPRIPIRDLLRIAKRWGFGRINVHNRPCTPKVASYLATYLGKGDSLPGLRKWGCIGDFVGSKTRDIEFGSKSVRAFRIAFRKLRQAGATRNQAFVGAKVAQRYFDHNGIFPETLNF